MYIIVISFTCLFLTAILQDDFDQEVFEELLAKWVAVSDQLFDTVENPEFRDLLQYNHHQRSDINIPGQNAI